MTVCPNCRQGRGVTQLLEPHINHIDTHKYSHTHLRGEVQGIETLLVRLSGVSPVAHEQDGGVEMALPYRPMQRRRLQVAPQRIHIRTFLEKIPMVGQISDKSS